MVEKLLTNTLDGIKLWVMFFIFLAVLATVITINNPDIALGIGLFGAFTMFMIHLIDNRWI